MHPVFANARECGGCRGLGAHWRWCPVAVGFPASEMGQLADRAEALGDRVGPNEMAAANHLWQAAGLLRAEAERRRAQFQAQQANQG